MPWSRGLAQAQPILINDARRPGLLATLRELWRYRELTGELCRRALRLRYKNSLLGIGWSLATPLMQTFLITIVVKHVLNKNIPNFSAYVLIGLFAWSFFAMAIPDACTCLLEHRSLLRKVYFPRELLVITATLSNLFHLLLALALAFGYLFHLGIVPRQRNDEVLLLLLILPAQFAIALGLGYFVSVLNVLFEDVRYIVSVLMTLLMYVVPVMYTIEFIAAKAQEPWSQPWLETHLRPHLLELYLLNPFSAVIVLFRQALLPPIQGAPAPWLPWSWGLMLQTAGLGAVLLVLGAWVFNRYKWTAVERL